MRIGYSPGLKQKLRALIEKHGIDDIEAALADAKESEAPKCIPQRGRPLGSGYKEEHLVYEVAKRRLTSPDPVPSLWDLVNQVVEEEDAGKPIGEVLPGDAAKRLYEKCQKAGLGTKDLIIKDDARAKVYHLDPAYAQDPKRGVRISPNRQAVIGAQIDQAKTKMESMVLILFEVAKETKTIQEMVNNRLGELPIESISKMREARKATKQQSTPNDETIAALICVSH